MILRYVTLAILIASVNTIQAARYITLSPHLTEILYDLNVGDEIVATVEHSDYPERAKLLPIIGNYQSLNIEAIVALKPDIIFAWPDGNPELQLERLSQLGIRIFRSAPGNLDDLISEIKIIGDMVDQPARAAIITEQMQNKIDDLRASYQQQKAVRIFYQIWHQPLRALGSDPWLNDLVSRCGAENIFAHLPQAYPQVSIEAVVEKQPDVIILPETNQQAAEQELWQNWPVLDAVKKNQIITINADWLHRYTSRSIRGLVSLCESLDAVRMTTQEIHQ